LKNAAEAARGAERVDHFEKELGRLSGVLETQNMRDPLVRLHREYKAGVRRLHPILQCSRRGQPAEGVIDLHAIQALRVVLQELLRRELGRIEARLPRRICKAGCSGKQRRHGISLSLATCRIVAMLTHWIVGW